MIKFTVIFVYYKKWNIRNNNVNIHSSLVIILAHPQNLIPRNLLLITAFFCFLVSFKLLIIPLEWMFKLWCCICFRSRKFGLFIHEKIFRVVNRETFIPQISYFFFSFFYFWEIIFYSTELMGSYSTMLMDCFLFY